MATVLVVDDQLHIRLLMQHILEEAGHNVLVTENGNEALALLANRSDVQLLFSDINMPVMDGFSLLKQLREQEVNLPVVLVTARGMEEDETLAETMGATVLTKPFSSRSLTQLVDKLVG